ncbi:MAG: 50S ribosomal protein L10 [Candidatus Buchananbacteria bacterium RIFCSPHIGHO2_02_FULL_38_8]|uniref:Large ribosomal subunit protein uL10 n=2 Tax=Candidatus Buchananiibacteriota TaxID=1817903 RepID=A0A1G1Y2Z6_9BACT|nr:MAG: 50S ribosomal protein L10 [Candidatus Buchananbacteria bacterium RIFCSPHIGHO2_01_FULL_39_8]OGY47489.1 MAG: 50S ribosomal protein L10 [Candidatus Buchananbacteria bacterium RIFCSPHIGHO2_02_FULL_38_8]
MAKTKQQKQEAVKSYTEKLKKAKGLVFANFDGLKVKEIEELRKKCREKGIDYIVAKKTLMKLALNEAGIESIDPKTFDKGVASVFGYEDEVVSAKIIGEFSKKHEALKPIGGILEYRFIDVSKVLELSKLPSRQELLAKVVGSMAAPVSGFVNVLAGNLRNLVGVLSAIKEIKG